MEAGINKSNGATAHVDAQPEAAREEAARRVFLWGALAVLVAFGLAVAGLRAADEAPEAVALRLMQGIGAELVERRLTAEEAEWPLETPQGATLRLADLPADTLVFLNFWATWCPPCREELPSMLGLREALGEHRFLMVGVSYDDDWEAVRGFFGGWLGAMPPPAQLTLVRDARGVSSGEDALRRRFGTDKLPDTVVLMNGRVLAKFTNARTWTDPGIVRYFKALAPLR
jgi:thiol-disulfide isomerase/thioredoxin